VTIAQRLPRKLVLPVAGIAGVLSLGAVAFAASGATTSIPVPTASTGSGPPPGYLSQIPSWKTPPIVPNGTPTAGTAPANAGGDASGANLNTSVPACAGSSACQLQGVSSNVQAPFPSSQFRVSNEYSGVYNGQPVMIYAGEKRGADSPSAPPGSSASAVVGGGIRVVIGTDPSKLQEFLAPNTPGPLSLSSVQDTTVLLQRLDGSTITFDLQTDTYR
jgi:hypothetical protein